MVPVLFLLVEIQAAKSPTQNKTRISNRISLTWRYTAVIHTCVLTACLEEPGRTNTTSAFHFVLLPTLHFFIYEPSARITNFLPSCLLPFRSLLKSGTLTEIKSPLKSKVCFCRQTVLSFYLASVITQFSTQKQNGTVIQKYPPIISTKGMYQRYKSTILLFMKVSLHMLAFSHLYKYVL